MFPVRPRLIGEFTRPARMRRSALARGDSVFAHRSFVYLWFARVATIIAYQMLAVGVGWQIYALTGSALDLGLVGLVQFLPSLVLVLLVGHVADRFDRRRILCGCQLVALVAAATLAIASATGWITQHAIFVLVFVIGGTRAFEMPTLQALLPALVPVRLLPRAVASAASATQTAIIVGPAIGGFLYVAGPAWTYATCAAAYLLAATLSMLIRYERPVAANPPATLQSVFAGLSFIRKREAVLGAITLDMIAVLLGGAAALFPIYAKEVLATGPWGLGILRSAPAVGALAIALYLARHPLRRHAGRTMFIAIAVFGVATIGFGLSRWLPLSLVFLVIMGAADMINVVIRSSLIQLSTPDHMRGRVGAVNALFIGTSNQLGEFESGVVAAWLGAVTSVVVGGIGTLVAVAVSLRVFTELANVDRLDSIRPVERAYIDDKDGTRVKQP
jgi:MFS family permease